MSQSATVIIDRPAEDVFNYVMDIPNDAHWRTRTGVVEAAYTSDPPLGVGTTGFDRISANGREFIVEWKTVEYEPGRLARWEFVSGPLSGFGSYICEPAGERTKFTLEANVRPSGPLRFLGPVFGMIARRQFKADVQTLKAILER